MKSKLITCFISACFFIQINQVFSQVVEKDFNYELFLTQVKMEVNNDGSLTYSIKYNGNSNSLGAADLTLSDFRLKIRKLFEDHVFDSTFKQSFQNSTDKQAVFQRQVEELFFYFYANIGKELPSDIPKAGTFYISGKCYARNEDGSSAYYHDYYELSGNHDSISAVDTLTIDSIVFTIEEGRLQNIVVYARDSSNLREFTNKTSIAFSRKSNYDNLNYVFLKEIQPKWQNSSNNRSVFINLGEVMKYVIAPEVKMWDFSPGDGSYSIRGNSKLTARKAARSELFDGVIYTDLFGRSENSPNGLVQTEIIRSWTLYTAYSSGLKRINSIPIDRAALKVVYSKFEENNSVYIPEPRYDLSRSYLYNEENLPIDSTTTVATVTYASPTKLRQYREYGVYVGLNYGSIEIPDLASRVSFPIYFGFSGSKIGSNAAKIVDHNLAIDTTLTIRKVTAREFSLGYRFDFFDDSRISVYMLTTKYFTFINDKDLIFGHFKYDPPLSKPITLHMNSYWNHEIGLSIKTNDNGRLFMRYGIVYDQFSRKVNSFDYFQVGYRFDVFKSNIKDIANKTVSN